MPANDLTLSTIDVYPLKAGRAAPLTTAHAGPGGFAGDRRWLLMTTSGTPVMLKSHPAMTRLRVALNGAGLTLSSDGLPDLDVPPPPSDAERIEATVKGDVIAAAAAGSEADAWFGNLLGDTVRLAYMPDDVKRPSKVDPSVAIGFAGDAPYLLVCDASLTDLNTHLNEPVAQDRFRANLTVTGGVPWQEDDWRVIRIGSAVSKSLTPATAARTSPSTPRPGPRTTNRCTRRRRSISSTASPASACSWASAKPGGSASVIPWKSWTDRSAPLQDATIVPDPIGCEIEIGVRPEGPVVAVGEIG